MHALYEDVVVLVELVDEGEDEDLAGELEAGLSRLQREVDQLELSPCSAGNTMPATPF